MLRKFLKEVMAIVVGKHIEDIVDLLDTKKYINEFVLAKKLDITINQTRNILYKISDYGLVSSIRKKDKRKGWYTYFWKIEILKSLEFLRANLIKKIDQFNHQIKSRETKRFYICERCNIEVSEENALIYNFTCNECGAIFTMKDNTKLIKELKKHLEKTKKDLELVEQEIKIEQEKLEKKKLRERKKEAITTKKKRLAKRKKTKKKAKKKSSKKESKKKSKIKIKKKTIQEKKKGKKIIKKQTKKLKQLKNKPKEKSKKKKR